MSQFLRLLSENDKAQALLEVSQHLRMGVADIRAFEVQPDVFDAVPGKPFAYWVNEAVRACFGRLEPFENAGRKVLGGLKTLSDERFLRCWWEADVIGGWLPIAKGGAYSPFYLICHWL